MLTTRKRTNAPLIIPRAEHNISRQNISPNALKVLTRLHNAGFQAFLVGGSVRDLLLGLTPKDFDVATNATPEEVKALFRNCRLIGRRFRLAHVHFGREIIEVATFRGHHGKDTGLEGQTQGGMIIRDNVFGSLEDDAWRRDFSINALYYNIADYSVIDYTGGMRDLKRSHIRMIGDPKTRYREDPVRMLRAVRFANKLGLNIHKKTAAPLLKFSQLLRQIPPSRLFEELLKLFLHGHAKQTFKQMREFRLFRQLFPLTADCLENDTTGTFDRFIQLALINTDQRVQEGKSVTPSFLLAVLLWQPVQELTKKLQQQKIRPHLAMEQAIQQVLQQQSEHVSIPRRFTHSMRAIWSMQSLFARRYGKRAFRLLEQPRFRAAFDFLILRAQAGEKVDQLANWWQEFSEATPEKRQQMTSRLTKHS